MKSLRSDRTCPAVSLATSPSCVRFWWDGRGLFVYYIDQIASARYSTMLLRAPACLGEAKEEALLWAT